jgi:hypothetical protein
MPTGDDGSTELGQNFFPAGIELGDGVMELGVVPGQDPFSVHLDVTLLAMEFLCGFRTDAPTKET